MRREIKVSLVIAVLIAGGIWLATRSSDAPDPQSVAGNDNSDSQSVAGSIDVADLSEPPQEDAPIVSEPLQPVEPVAATPPILGAPPAGSDVVSSPAPAPLIGAELPSDRPDGAGISADPGDSATALPTPAIMDPLPSATATDDMPSPETLLNDPPGALTVASSTPMPPTSGGIPTAVQPPAAPTPGTAKPAAVNPANVHVVKAGESFSTIAQQHYGHAKYANRIGQANPSVDPRRLQIGYKLKLPAIPEAETSAAAASERSENSTARTPAAPIGIGSIPEGRSYTIKPGEGWRQLARRFLGNEARWPELYELNKGRVPTNPEGLRAGMNIELPEGANPNQG